MDNGFNLRPSDPFSTASKSQEDHIDLHYMRRCARHKSYDAYIKFESTYDMPSDEELSEGLKSLVSSLGVENDGINGACSMVYQAFDANVRGQVIGCLHLLVSAKMNILDMILMNDPTLPSEPAPLTRRASGEDLPMNADTWGERWNDLPMNAYTWGEHWNDLRMPAVRETMVVDADTGEEHVSTENVWRFTETPHALSSAVDLINSVIKKGNNTDPRMNNHYTTLLNTGITYLEELAKKHTSTSDDTEDTEEMFINKEKCAALDIMSRYICKPLTPSDTTASKPSRLTLRQLLENATKNATKNATAPSDDFNPLFKILWKFIYIELLKHVNKCLDAFDQLHFPHLRVPYYVQQSTFKLACDNAGITDEQLEQVRSYPDVLLARNRYDVTNGSNTYMNFLCHHVLAMVLTAAEEKTNVDTRRRTLPVTPTTEEEIDISLYRKLGELSDLNPDGDSSEYSIGRFAQNCVLGICDGKDNVPLTLMSFIDNSVRDALAVTDPFPETSIDNAPSPEAVAYERYEKLAISASRLWSVPWTNILRSHPPPYEWNILLKNHLEITEVVPSSQYRVKLAIAIGAFFVSAGMVEKYLWRISQLKDELLKVAQNTVEAISTRVSGLEARKAELKLKADLNNIRKATGERHLTGFLAVLDAHPLKWYIIAMIDREPDVVNMIEALHKEVTELAKHQNEILKTNMTFLNATEYISKYNATLVEWCDDYKIEHDDSTMANIYHWMVEWAGAPWAGVQLNETGSKLNGLKLNETGSKLNGLKLNDCMVNSTHIFGGPPLNATQHEALITLYKYMSRLSGIRDGALPFAIAAYAEVGYQLLPALTYAAYPYVTQPAYPYVTSAIVYQP